MNKRPRSITVIGVIFIAFGGIALLSNLLDAASSQNLAEFKARRPFEYAPVFVLRVLALFSGVFILYGFNWARWLLVVIWSINAILTTLGAMFWQPPAEPRSQAGSVQGPL